MRRSFHHLQGVAEEAETDWMRGYERIQPARQPDRASRSSLFHLLSAPTGESALRAERRGDRDRVVSARRRISAAGGE